jgi:hypothetical protein
MTARCGTRSDPASMIPKRSSSSWHSDLRYVEGLVAPGVINTMPMATLDAFADHGDVGASLGADTRPAEELLEKVRALSPSASHLARC